MKFLATNSALRKVLAQMKPIAVNAAYAPILTGVLIEVKDDVVTMTATDRYRIIFARLEVEPSGLEDGKMVVPIIPLQRALRAVTIQSRRSEDAVMVSDFDTSLLLHMAGGITVTVPELEGAYPDVWRLLGTILPQDELVTHSVNPEYARDLMPRDPYSAAQVATSVGEKGYMVVGHHDSLSVLVPVDYGKSQPFKVPEFIETRMANQ